MVVSSGSTGEFVSQVNYRLIEELSAAERRYRDLVENLHDIVFLYDSDGKITFANQAWVDNLGYTMPEILGRQVLHFVHPEDQARVEAALSSSDGAGHHKEVRLFHVYGSTVWFELSVRKDAAAPSGGGVGLLYNISRRKSVEHELQQSRDGALELVRLKSYLLATMSHEIRTPMNGVMGVLELLAGVNRDPDCRDYIETAQRSAQTLLSLLNDILDFSKIDAGAMVLEDVDYDVRLLVKDTVRLAEASARKADICFHYTVAEDVPDQVRGDVTRLRQVLNNLLGNAVKFTAQGEISVSVSYTGGKQGGQLSFTVSDTGIGITPDEQGKIFDAYVQANQSVHRKFGGTGLGLAICKRLVEAMGGRIGVDSEPGRGSTFRFSVFAGQATYPHSTSAKQFGYTHNSRRVLLAEDNDVNRKVAVAMLSKLGYEVDTVENGEAAVQEALAGDYAAILMDCQMPVMDGYEAARRIRAGEGADKRTPIIALTAVDGAEYRQLCIDASMDDFLTKPTRIEQLHDALAKWMV